MRITSNRFDLGPNERVASIKKCGLACALIALVAAALFVAAAYALTKIDVAKATLGPLSTTITSVVTAVSGYIVARIRGKKGLLTGCEVGIGVFLASVIGYIAFSDDPVTVQMLYKLIAFVASGGVGGIAGVAKSGSNRRYKQP